MKKLLAALAVISAGMLSGCTSLPSEQEISDADYGAYPDDYENWKPYINPKDSSEKYAAKESVLLRYLPSTGLIAESSVNFII